MTKVAQDFSWYEGDDRNLVVVITDNDDAVVNLTSFEVSWVMSRSGTVILTKLSDSTAGIEITDAANGEITIYLDPADNAGLSGFYDHECVLTDSAGNIVTAFRGTCKVISDLT